MARKRYVTSDMSNDEQLAEIAAVNPVAALMWPWIITGMDDWGRMTASPMKIKLTIFPAFPYSAEDIEGAIDLYAENGLVYLYGVNSHRYMAVEPGKWFFWQNYIHSEKRTVDKSSIPAPVDAPWQQVEANPTGDEREETELSEDERKPAEPSGDERDSVPSPSSLPPFTFDPSEDKRSSSPPDGATPPDPDEPFDDEEDRCKGKKLFPESSIEYVLAFLLRSEILKNLPEARVPKATPEGMAGWCGHIDKMIRLDERGPTEIRAVIIWCQRDPFWRAVILSPKKLRDKWEQLVLQSKREEAQPHEARRSPRPGDPGYDYGAGIPTPDG